MRWKNLDGRHNPPRLAWNRLPKSLQQPDGWPDIYLYELYDVLFKVENSLRIDLAWIFPTST